MYWKAKFDKFLDSDAFLREQFMLEVPIKPSISSNSPEEAGHRENHPKVSQG